MDNEDIEAVLSVYEKDTLKIVYDAEKQLYLGVFKTNLSQNNNLTNSLSIILPKTDYHNESNVDDVTKRVQLDTFSEFIRGQSQFFTLANHVDKQRDRILLRHLPPIVTSFCLRRISPTNSCSTSSWKLERLFFKQKHNLLPRKLLNSSLAERFIASSSSAVYQQDEEEEEEFCLWRIFETLENEAFSLMFPGPIKSLHQSKVGDDEDCQPINTVEISLEEFVSRAFDMKMSSNENAASSSASSSAAAAAESAALLLLARTAKSLRSLLTHSEAEEARIFSATHHDCCVCFERVIGRACVRFSPCGHAFCRDCVCAAFTTNIQSDARLTLTCLQAGCDSPASQSQVRACIPADVYDNWERWSLQRCITTELGGDVQTCPSCDAPMVVQSAAALFCPPTGEQLEERVEERVEDRRLAQCPRCQFAFCVLCRRTWHGANNRCKLKMGGGSGEEAPLQVLAEYRDADEAGRHALQVKYGAEIARAYENWLSEERVASSSVACPKCRALIHKLAGCNKMTCAKCATKFCYLCGVTLPPDNPYAHFNVPGGSKCYGKLFGANYALNHYDYLEDDEARFEDGGRREIDAAHNQDDDDEEDIDLDELIALFD